MEKVTSVALYEEFPAPISTAASFFPAVKKMPTETSRMEKKRKIRSEDKKHRLREPDSSPSKAALPVSCLPPALFRSKGLFKFIQWQRGIQPPAHARLAAKSSLLIHFKNDPKDSNSMCCIRFSMHFDSLASKPKLFHDFPRGLLPSSQILAKSAGRKFCLPDLPKPSRLSPKNGMERNVHCQSNRHPKSAIFITFVCRFGDNPVTKSCDAAKIHLVIN